MKHSHERRSGSEAGAESAGGGGDTHPQPLLPHPEPGR